MKGRDGWKGAVMRLEKLAGEVDGEGGWNTLVYVIENMRELLQFGGLVEDRAIMRIDLQR
jgi:hypothetical protein